MTDSYALQESHNKLVPSNCVLNNQKERHAVLTHLAQIYGVSRITSFPGGHPSTITRRDVPRVRLENSVVALKTDGVRYLLLLCTIGSAFRAIMVDRKLQMYEILVFANEDFFAQRTLLDGELVLNHQTNCLCYQVFDVVHMRGRRYNNMTYYDRLQTLHDRMLSELPAGISEDSREGEDYIVDEDKIYVSVGNHMRLSMAPKRFVPLHNVRRLWSDRNTSPFPTDGLIINFEHSPIQCGTLQTVLKWKPHNAIDVLVDAETMSVVCRSSGTEERLERLRCAGRVYSVALRDNHLLQWLLHCKRQKMPWLVECLVEMEDDRVSLWPMRERLDKVEANDKRIIEATLETISQNVTLDELVASDLATGGSGSTPVQESETPNEAERHHKRHAVQDHDVPVRRSKRRGRR